jgi:hypothetical protein
MPAQQFKRIIGTTKPVFLKMLAVLQAAHIKLHEKGGSPRGPSVGDKLLITLQYHREYRTQERIGQDFGVSKSVVCRAITWVEDTLSADGQFQLPGKQSLQEGVPKTVAVDVTEHPIERPKKDQKDWYSGKKKDTQLNRKSSETETLT